MQLNHFSDKQLNALLSQAKQWLALDKQLKQYVPIVLHPHFKVVRVEQGVLIIHAHHAMVAARLKLLIPSLLVQVADTVFNIQSIRITHYPEQTAIEREKNFHIPAIAIEHFAQTAEKVAHHEHLAAAINQLVQRHQV